MSTNPLEPFDLFDAPQNEPPANREAPFTLHQIVDRQHNGVVASVFEYPPGWQAYSEISWNYQNVSMPVQAHAQAFAPRGGARIDFLSPESFYWLEPNYGFCQPGQSGLGQTAMPPMSAIDAMTQVVLPKHRGKHAGLRIVGAGPVPDLARRLGPAAGAIHGEDVCVRMEYSENGRPLEEEFYATKTQQNVPYHGPIGTMIQINWGFARLFSFREERGRLDARRDLFWRIAGSARINPLWENLCAQIMEQLRVQFEQYIQAGYSQIQAAGQLSRAISANNDAMLRGFEQQRHASHVYSVHSSAPARSASEGFDEYIRGVETVQDPYYGESQQDANYQYHWTDGYGNYQQSNDAFFNPNIGSAQTWTLMERKAG